MSSILGLTRLIARSMLQPLPMDLCRISALLSQHCLNRQCSSLRPGTLDMVVVPVTLQHAMLRCTSLPCNS